MDGNQGHNNDAEHSDGNGYDDYGCGEFCATTHQFSLEDAAGKEIAAYMQNFSLPDTDSQFGCANYGYRNGVAVQQVNGGGDVAFPNEHGTWTYDGATANVCLLGCKR